MTIFETILPVNTTCNGQRNNNWKRTNGLQLPLDIQQILGWFALFFLLLSSFYILLPSLGNELKAIWLCIFGSLCFLHIVSHIAALLIDPSDPELLFNRKCGSSTIITPEYDPNRHLHVIEHGRCHICNIKASGPRTKHCRCCNKCIEKFDHHCKWLNNCIGCKNYVAFIISIISAALSCHVILISAVWILATQTINPDLLDELFNTNVFNHTFNNDDFISQTSLPLPDLPLKCILVFQIILSGIAAGLLTHLCLFHAYISILGVTTYEYIRNMNSKINSNTNATITPVSNNGVINTINGFDSSTSTIVTSYNSDAIEGYAKHHAELKVKNDKETCVNNFFICYGKNHDKSQSRSNLTLNESVATNRSMIIESPVDTTDRILQQQQQQQRNDGHDNVPLMYCEHCKTLSPLTLYPLHHQTQQLNVPSSRLKCCATHEQHTINYIGTRSNRINPITSSDSSTNHIYVKPRRASSLNSLPSLPPPPRRQIQSVSLKELNEMLTYAQRPQTVRLRRTNVVPIRRQLRRKSNPQLKPFLSAHLSPIHESGLSNPSTPHLKDKTQKNSVKTNPSPLAQ